jgi:glutamate racemase
MIGKEVETLAILALAGAIEEGVPDAKIEEIITNAGNSVDRTTFDTVVLACTHYPLVLNVFQRVFGSQTVVFDPADAVAARVETQWWPRESGNGTLRFLISQESEPFRRLVSQFFPKDTYSIEVIQ